MGALGRHDRRALALDAIGQVPWWPEDRREVTLHRILLHLIAETDKHAGHADIVRELIDGAAGLREDHDNMGQQSGIGDRQVPVLVGFGHDSNELLPLAREDSPQPGQS